MPPGPGRPTTGRHRELESRAARIKPDATWADGADASAAFNAAQDYLLRAAHVHVDRVVLEVFAAAIDAGPDAEVAAVLDRCATYTC